MKVGNKQVVLLKCTTSYPADVSEANLIMIKKYSEEYGVLTGLSDHTLGAHLQLCLSDMELKL